jgi:hypothetical protein
MVFSLIHQIAVIPGLTGNPEKIRWIPACAGMTKTITP